MLWQLNIICILQNIYMPSLLVYVFGGWGKLSIYFLMIQYINLILKLLNIKKQGECKFREPYQHNNKNIQMTETHETQFQIQPLGHFSSPTFGKL